MALNPLPKLLKELSGAPEEKRVLEDVIRLREEALQLDAAEEYEKAARKTVDALRAMRDAPDFSGIQFRAVLALLLFDLSELHFTLKDYKQSEKELETLFKVLDSLLHEDRETFGPWHVTALELSTRILRSRKKMLDLLAKQQINTGMLYEKVNSGVAAATDKLVDSLRKGAQMMASTGDYRSAVRFYMEAIRMAKKRAGKVTRREVEMTVEMARVMMHSKSEQARARRLLNAVLPHAVALETVELEQEILSMIETIDANLVHDPKWRQFLDKLRHPRTRKGSGDSENPEKTEDSGK